MDNEKIEITRDSLKKLISNSTWLISVFLIAFFGKIQAVNKITLGQFTIDSELTGWFVLAISGILTLVITKNYDSVISNFKGIEKEENIKTAKFFLNSYSHLLNPFAEQEGSIRTKLLDIWGYTVISITPLLTFFLGVSYIENKSSVEIIIISIIGLVIYLLHIEQIFTEKYAIYLICPDSEKFKRYTSIVGILVVVIIYVIYKYYF